MKKDYRVTRILFFMIITICSQHGYASMSNYFSSSIDKVFATAEGAIELRSFDYQTMEITNNLDTAIIPGVIFYHSNINNEHMLKLFDGSATILPRSKYLFNITEENSCIFGPQLMPHIAYSMPNIAVVREALYDRNSKTEDITTKRQIYEDLNISEISNIQLNPANTAIDSESGLQNLNLQPDDSKEKREPMGIAYQNITNYPDLLLSLSGEELSATTNRQTLEFKKPGDKTIEIINGSEKKVILKNILFVGDQFSSYPTARSITTKGFQGCSEIPAGKSCAFIVTAAKNASASIYPDGQQFFITYKTEDKGELKSTSFMVKVDYNQDVVFGARNLNFKTGGLDPNFDPYDDNCNKIFSRYPETNKLTIINNSKENSVNITSVKLDQDDSNIIIGDITGCSNIEVNSSCKVDISVGPEVKNGALPVYVTYDIGDKKDVVATAAVIVAFPDSDGDMPLFNGLQLVVGAVRASSKTVVKELRKIFLRTDPVEGSDLDLQYLPDVPEHDLPVEIASFYPLAMVNKGIDKLTSSEDWKYESRNIINQVTEATAKAGVTMLFPNEKLEKKIIEGVTSYPYYYSTLFSCNAISGILGNAIIDIIIPPADKYLPEEDSFLIKHKQAISFGIKASIKIGCLAVTQGYDGVKAVVDVISEVVTGVGADNISPSSLKKTSKSNKPIIDSVCQENSCKCWKVTWRDDR